MAFVQKDRFSRKDILERNQEGKGPDPEGTGKPKVIIHKEADGKSHMHFIVPNEGRSVNPHLDDLLAKLEREAEEAQDS